MLSAIFAVLIAFVAFVIAWVVIDSAPANIPPIAKWAAKVVIGLLILLLLLYYWPARLP
jgi:lipid-A-disaccharide synthase-like uncharacterized protein